LTSPVAAPSGRACIRGTLLVLSLGLAAAGAWGHEHGAPTQASTKPGAVLYTEDELEFLTHMIVHHEQALVMAALVPARSQREEFRRFARYVDGSQRVEIDQMKSLLGFAADRGIEIPHHEMTGDPPMTGMLSKSQMAALAAASGPEFERLWLQGMIYHHQGALDMARAQQQRQFESGRQPYGIDVLVDDILVVQRAEITKMKGWLTQWGLASPTDAH
jgi:uncharacterized protein (DUF305 family)